MIAQCMQDERQAHRWLGTALAASSAVAYSTAGYFTWLIELDVLTMLFWRGLYAGRFMSACIVLLHGKETVATVRNIGLPGLLADKGCVDLPADGEPTCGATIARASARAMESTVRRALPWHRDR